MSTVLSELDDSLSGMSGTQVSQWVREKLPSGQGEGRSCDNGPKNDSEMLAFLLEEDLEVKNNKEIMKMLSLIKTTDSYEQNIKRDRGIHISLR